MLRKEWTPATLALSSSPLSQKVNFAPNQKTEIKHDFFYFYFSHTAVEGAICKNGLPVELIPKTNRRQRITRVTLAAANCDHR